MIQISIEHFSASVTTAAVTPNIPAPPEIGSAAEPGPEPGAQDGKHGGAAIHMQDGGYTTDFKSIIGANDAKQVHTPSAALACVYN